MVRLSFTLHHHRLSPEPIELVCEVTDGVLPAQQLERIATLVAEQIDKATTAAVGDRETLEVAKRTKVSLPRSQNGCLTCRRRRVKCDEAKPICTSCKRNPNRVCRYQVSIERHSRAVTASTSRISTPSVPAETIPPSAVKSPKVDVADVALLLSRPSSPLTLKTEANLLLLYHLSTVTFSMLGGGSNTRFRFAQLQQAWTLSLHSLLPCCVVAWAEHFNYVQPSRVDQKELSEKLRKEIMFKLSMLSIPEDGHGLEIEELNLILGAADLLATRDIIAADRDWRALLQFTVTLVQTHGGPEAIINRLSDPGKREAMRCMLLHHAAWELFSCLSTGTSPTLLAEGSTLWCEQDEACYAMIEQEFGISLPVLLTAAQVCDLVAATRSRGLQESIQSDAASLYAGLEEIWLATICASPNRPRIQSGNFLFRHTMICVVLRDVLGYSATHPRIRQSVSAIRELLIEAMVVNMAGGMMVGMLQPALVGGSMAAAEERDTFAVVLREMQ
ncbi:hypothetical protein BCR39DRAFT_542320 [Naematelia encephala]|uniref:Zn(2)-C6 fungal-type domain-containing protein n=1 Tax=Naematelia encephala TaxID=71784 RepID=A0A1Y2AU78_9TREE|nr:hypothetical protein BCR39DRAFT_542320 [Naematelia encephala]